MRVEHQRTRYRDAIRSASGVKVVLYEQRSHVRSRMICDAMQLGISRQGDFVFRTFEDQFKDVGDEWAVFYGLDGNLKTIFEQYSKIGRAVYVDLGYWGRLTGGKLAGYHKIVLNGRHPEGYYRRNSPADRFAVHGVEVKPWRETGGHILVAGMGDKAARFEGFAPEAWERNVIEQLQRLTHRRIVYRPKPSWKEARPIQGVDYSEPRVPFENALKGAWAVVTHHSNVAVDAILAGIPAFCWKGVAREMSSQDIGQIERPIYPDNREQWAADIAYTQWSVVEIAQGLPWAYFRREGLVA